MLPPLEVRMVGTPQAKLLLSGSTLYGTTAYGGSNNCGTVFAINDQENVTVSGGNTAVTNLHTFNGNDGFYLLSDLVLFGNTLFGTASQGGCYGAGTVFALKIDGTGFTNLFNFAFTNGASPQAGLVLSGNTLYGTTANGGAHGGGTIFSINTDGTGFTNFFNFGYTNGANPEADLLLLGSTLYGTTVNGGGSNGWGTVFSINTNGTGFTNLFVFNNGTNGANPHGGLALVGNVLCGTTLSGGYGENGTVFSIATNGTDFSNYYITSLPYSGLTVSSNGPSSYMLYGTTFGGGQFSHGTVYALNVGGPDLTFSNLNVVHSFDSSDGQSPAAGLVLSGSTLYGAAEYSDSSLGGNVFSVTTNGVFTDLHDFQGPPSFSIDTNSDGAVPQAGLVLSGNTLYGTTGQGGTSGEGTIFAVNNDGTSFTNLCNVNNLNATPLASLVLSGNTLYGTASVTVSGTGPGAVFSINTDGTGFTNLCNFGGTEDSLPMGNLIVSGNTLYGVTEIGGDNSSEFDDGAVFSLNTDGTDFSNIFVFNGYNSDYAYFPDGGLVLASNKLYGTTEEGSFYGYGIVFVVNTDGTGFTNLFDFNGADGSEPTASLVLSGNTLYGITQSDANRNFGTIFAVNTDGTGFTNLYSFNGYDGATPLGSLVLSGNTLYGTTSAGGNGGYGTVFSINTNGTGFTTLYNFSGGNDGASPYDGLILSGNTLYGTTALGGSEGNGTVFALSLGPIPLDIQQAGTNVVLMWGNPEFSLQAASAIAGPYITVPDATSPYTNVITGAQQFFRLQSQ
jgi:uncharacterized repeat protein (TIGR03803 family)